MKRGFIIGITLVVLLVAGVFVAHACTSLQFQRTGTCQRTTTLTDQTTGLLVGTWTTNSGCGAPVYQGHTYVWYDGCRTKYVYNWNGQYNLSTWDCNDNCDD